MRPRPRPIPGSFWVVLVLAVAPARGQVAEIPVLNDWQHYNDTGHMAMRRGNLDRAASAFRMAIETLRPHQPKQIKLMVRSNLDFARVLHLQDRNDEAAPLARWALQIRESRSGTKPEEIAQAITLLAKIEQARARPAEAETLLLRALPLQRQATGANRLDLLETLETLAAVQAEQRKDQAASISYRQALAVREATSDDDLKVADQADIHARLLRLQGRIIDAERLEEESRKLREASLQSTGAAAASERLAVILRRTNRNEEAEDLEARARALRDQLDTKAARGRSASPSLLGR